WYPTDATSAGSAVPVQTGPDGSIYPNVNFALTAFTGVAPRTISGKVTDDHGNPVRFGTVTALDPNFTYSVRGTGLNGDGSYTLPNLPASRFLVRFQAEGTSPQTMYQTRVWSCPDPTLPTSGLVITGCPSASSTEPTTGAGT